MGRLADQAVCWWPHVEWLAPFMLWLLSLEKSRGCVCHPSTPKLVGLAHLAVHSGDQDHEGHVLAHPAGRRCLPVQAEEVGVLVAQAYYPALGLERALSPGLVPVAGPRAEDAFAQYFVAENLLGLLFGQGFHAPPLVPGVRLLVNGVEEGLHVGSFEYVGPRDLAAELFELLARELPLVAWCRRRRLAPV